MVEGHTGYGGETSPEPAGRKSCPDCGILRGGLGYSRGTANPNLSVGGQ